MTYQESTKYTINPEPLPRLSNSIRPVPITGAAVLTKLAFDQADLDALLATYQSRLDGPPDDAGIVLDMSTILQLAFNKPQAMQMQADAIAQQQIYRVVGRNGDRKPENGSPLRVLALVAPGDLMVNTPLEFILVSPNVELYLLYLLPGKPLPAEIPNHDVAFAAVSEPDDNAALLERLKGLVRRWPRPVVNDPERILELSRERVYEILHSCPGVKVPMTLRLGRSQLEELASGTQLPTPEELRYPILIRPVGSHAGNELQKIDDAEALARYLASVATHREFYLMPFIDYAGSDGRYRKYRVVFIDHKPYLCHMAVSENWMIHYLNAGMTESEEKRSEEAAAMEQFDERFAARHREALASIDSRIALDYWGIDCAETPDGKLLIFEADVAMVIHDMDPPDLFPYKQPQMRKIFAAFETMLESAARKSASEGVQ